MTAVPLRRPSLAILPILAFAALALLFWKGLSGNPAEIPSALIGRPAPEFTLAPVRGLGVPGLGTADLKAGKVTLVNVWGAWCASCKSEHPLLMDLSRRADIALVGIDYKDDPENARGFLLSLGQPFARIGADETGRAALDWGVYGAPETFIVDGRGIIRYKWIGPLSAAAIARTLDPEIDKAKAVAETADPAGPAETAAVH